MTGTELEIIPPERSQIAGSDAERQPSLQTTARTDLELLAVWLPPLPRCPQGCRR